MTDLLLNPEDTGEIPRPVGETLTRIIPAAPGETTQNLGEYVMRAPSFDAIPRRVFDLDDTVIYMPETIGVVGLDDKPHPKPPPLPKPPTGYDPQTQRISLLGAVAGLDGELHSKPQGYVGRHRDPLDRIAVEGEGQWGRLVEAAKPAGEPRRWRVLVGVGAFVAFASAVTTAVLVVFW